jgi:hypothetical protein
MKVPVPHSDSKSVTRPGMLSAKILLRMTSQCM